MINLPEELLLDGQSIDPVDMSHFILQRTRAIVMVLMDSLGVEEMSGPEEAINVLWQVRGNLDCLEKVVDYWHKEEQS